PFCSRRRVRNENFSQIRWYSVYRTTGDRSLGHGFQSISNWRGTCPCSRQLFPKRSKGRFARDTSELRASHESHSSRCSKSGKISRMELKVLFSEDPAFVLSRAGVFLSSQPVLHNLILSILYARASEGDPGRYWL